MQRIATTNKAVDLFGAGKHGYQAGNPTTALAATEMSAAALNAMQEEIALAIEASGAVLDPANNAQLLEAIRLLSQTLGDGRYAALAGLATQLFSVASATSATHALRLDQLTATLATSGWVKLPVWTGAGLEWLILQWMPVATTVFNNGFNYAILPIAFPTAFLKAFVAGSEASLGTFGSGPYSLSQIRFTNSYSGTQAGWAFCIGK